MCRQPTCGNSVNTIESVAECGGTKVTTKRLLLCLSGHAWAIPTGRVGALTCIYGRSSGENLGGNRAPREGTFRTAHLGEYRQMTF